MKLSKLFSVVLLACFGTTAGAQEGAWGGELDIQGTKLPLVFHFSPDGCTMDSPAQGAMGIPAEKSVASDSTVQVAVPAIGAKFTGKKDGRVITGTFVQNGFSLPLTLSPRTPKVNRPQTPVPPFPYREENVTFANQGFTFGGTLTLPPNCTKATPVVLMVTGSGLQNRDEELFGHKPFAVIADALARQGVASLRYDDRGYGVDGYRPDAFTTADFKGDAEAAMKLLRGRFDKVGVLGHSEGGTIALMMAAEGTPDFVVSLAGMAVSGMQTIVSQNRTALSSAGLPAATADKYCEVISTVLGELAAGKKYGDLSLDGVPDGLKPVLEKSARQCETPYFVHFLNLDVSQSLGKIKCPVLALNGTKDMQVDCTANLQALRSGLSGCKHEVKAFDGLNHLFQHCQTGSVAEYQQIEETFAPEVLDALVGWLKAL